MKSEAVDTVVHDLRCAGCDAKFEKANAKFCGRCGLRRKDPAAAAVGPPLVAASKSAAPPSTTTSPPAVSAPSSATAGTIVPPISPMAPERTKPFEKLYDCLHQLGLLSYYTAMEAAGMHDEALSFVEDEDLVAVGLSKPFERRRLLAALQRCAGSVRAEYLASQPSASSTATQHASSSLPTDVPSATDASAVTLAPGAGLSPELLETSNADSLRGYCRGTLLGRGTYGSVYMGMLPTGRFTAVKEIGIGPEGLKSEELVAISREVTMMRRLRHDNICEFFGCAYDAKEAKLCLFMELVTGGSLSGLVKRFKPLPQSVIRSWTRQLLVGLSYLHTNKIIHRDVKADNVLVDINSRTPLDAAIKLADFGAAKRVTDAVSGGRTVCGTPYWMAPEVFKAGDGYSYPADVWSLGCTVVEMFTGKPPWPTKSNVPATILMIASSETGPTELPTMEADGATPESLAFLSRCFTMDPAKRPSCEELLRDPWLLQQP